MDEPRKQPDYLRRLPRRYYQGAAWVHWVMTIRDRRKGWLDGKMHSSIREALFQTLARYRLVCPVYTLMPDHGHLVWCGCSAESDQLRAASFFRKEWNSSLRSKDYELQKQPYEHVLIESERNQDAFEDTCIYVMKNPERDRLVENWNNWEFGGSVVPGYPWVDPRKDRFWKRFWGAYNELRDPELL